MILPKGLSENLLLLSNLLFLSIADRCLASSAHATGSPGHITFLLKDLPQQPGTMVVYIRDLLGLQCP